jgi:hypothetical protein
MDRFRKRLRLEIVLAALSAVMCALTLVVPEWIEVLTGGWSQIRAPEPWNGSLPECSSLLQWCLPCSPVGTIGSWRPTGHKYDLGGTGQIRPHQVWAFGLSP